MFYVKVMRDLHWVGAFMNHVTTKTDDRYWSKVLFSKRTTHFRDLEVNQAIDEKNFHT